MQAFDTKSFTVIAGQEKTLGLKVTVVMVEDAAGTVTFRTTEGAFEATVGRVYGFPQPITLLGMSDTVNERVKLTYGQGYLLFNPAWAGVGGGVAVAVDNTPVGPDLMQGPAGLVPLQSENGVALNTLALNEALGFFTAGVDGFIPTARFRTARMVIDGAPGDTATLAHPDILAPPVTIYDRYGRVLSNNGTLTIGAAGTPVTVGTEIWVNVAGFTVLRINNVVGAMSFTTYLSPYHAMPDFALDGIPSVVLNGAFALGANNLLPAPGARSFYRVYGYKISAGAADSFSFKSGATVLSATSIGVTAAQEDSVKGLFDAPVNGPLDLNAVAGVANGSVQVRYQIITL